MEICAFLNHAILYIFLYQFPSHLYLKQIEFHGNVKDTMTYTFEIPLHNNTHHTRTLNSIKRNQFPFFDTSLTVHLGINRCNIGMKQNHQTTFVKSIDKTKYITLMHAHRKESISTFALRTPTWTYI